MPMRIPAADRAPRKSSVAGSRADIVAWGLDWRESQLVSTGQLTAGYPSRALAPGYRPGWVWQLSCSRWFRPPTRGTAGQSGTGAAGWAGLQRRGKGRNCNRSGGECEGAAGAGAGGGAELGRVLASPASRSDLPPHRQRPGGVDPQPREAESAGGQAGVEAGPGLPGWGPRGSGRPRCGSPSHGRGGSRPAGSWEGAARRCLRVPHRRPRLLLAPRPTPRAQRSKRPL